MAETHLPSPTLPEAEILLWQGRFRRSFVGIVGFIGLALKWSGLIASTSVLASQIGNRAALGVAVGIALIYLAFNEGVMSRLSRDGSGASTLAGVVRGADFVFLFAVAYALTPPSEYSRVLIVSIFIIQFTRLYFGLRATMISVITIAVLYTILILVAIRGGAQIAPAEEFWNLVMYVLGALLLNQLHGTISGRLERVMALFERAHEGDFGVAYDDSLDRMPDAITVIGRAYNRLRERLESMVLTDPLSGCFNRRGFNQLSAREVSRAIRGQHAMSVLAIDVDHFKKVNDEFGHLTGDEVLREMGARLRETARAGDVVARIGGEEFEILAPDTAAAGALILADRIQAAFRTRPFQSVGGRKISVSIGIASETARNDQIVATLVVRADESLYVAKKNGRDRSQLWEPGLRAFDGTLPGRRSIEVHAADLKE